MNLSIKILAEADKAVKELGQVSQGVSGINDKLDALKEKGKFWGHISVGFIALREAMQAVSGEFQQLVRVADDYANMNAKLKLATGAQQEFNTAYQQLFRIAQQTAAPLGETVQLYARLAPGLKQLGATQAELLAVTELTGKALALSGANAGEAAASMTQFAQALGSGKLRGDEFNSLMEQAPRLMKAVADGMGQPISRLREMAEAGELSADRVVKALLSQKEVMEREFAHLPLTVGRAWQQLENQFARLVGETDAQTGSTRRLAEAIQTLADNLSGLVGTLELVVKLGGALLASSPAFRCALVDLLVEAGLYGARGQARHARIRAASEMVASGNRRAAAQGMLRERFAVSRRTAYRDLQAAIDIRQGSLF